MACLNIYYIIRQIRDFQAAELLRHPHLQSYVAQYNNLSVVFLPVKFETATKTRINPSNKRGQNKESDDKITAQGENNCKIINSASSSSDSSTLSTDRPDGQNICNEDSNKKDENPTLHEGGKDKTKPMESLLELCAQLLKHERLEELAGVLKPYGEEAVSSRETAIWLTKGLMNIQKQNGEAN